MCDLATFLKWQPPWVASQTGMHLPNFPSLSPRSPPTSFSQVPPPGFPSPKDFPPCPKGFPRRPTPRTRLPNRFLECGQTCSPLPPPGARPLLARRAAHAPEGPRRPRAPRAPLSLPRTPAPERRASPRPARTAAAGHPAINKGTGPGGRVPERTGRGQLLSPGAPPLARGERREGRAARGRQAGMEGGTAR